MNAEQQRDHSRLISVNEYGLNHPLNPPVARATVLFGSVSDLADEFNQHGGYQHGGYGIFQDGTEERRALAKELRSKLVDIGNLARSLDQAQFPETANVFKLPKNRSYQSLIGAAHGILEAVVPIKQQFIDRSLAPDFDTKLAAKLAQFEAATHRKYRGSQKRREGTVALGFATTRAKAVIQELDAIVTAHLRESDPSLLPVWKTAVTKRRAPRRKKEEEAAPTEATPTAQT